MKIPCVVRAGLMLVTAGAVSAQPPAVAPEAPAVWSKPADTPNDSLVSPEVSADGRVTFRIYAPEAKRVSIRMNSDFGKGPLDLVKDDQGVWSVSSEPVPAGAYRYNFMVDGATVPDNRNPHTSPGALNVQSVVAVSRGPDDIHANRPGIPHGTVSTVYYDSPVSGGPRRLHLYLPPDYEKGKDYPVLYLIHGGGDDDAAWPTVGRANFILDNLIADGKAKPMVVVFPNGGVNGNLQQVPEPDKDPFIPELMTVILPYIEANYRVSKLPEHRALAGLSRGGNQTAYIGMTHTGAVPLPRHFQLWISESSGVRGNAWPLHPPGRRPLEAGLFRIRQPGPREARGGERPENVRPPWHPIPIGRNSRRPCLGELATLSQPLCSAALPLKNRFRRLTRLHLSEELHSPSSPEAS